jgi:hypothetical protein
MDCGRLAGTCGWTVISAGLLLLIGSGCAPQPYLSGYAYAPRPAVAQVFRRGTQQSPPLTALATVIGIRRADPNRHAPAAVVIRLRFENNGPQTASFDPGTLELVTGTLQAFPRPAITPPTTIDLAAGQRADVNASFPFPPGTGPGQMDLNNLRLRWTVRVDNFPVPQTALFERAGPDYAPEAPGPYEPSDVAY